MENKFDTVQDLEQYLNEHTDLCMLREHWNKVTAEEASVLFSKEKKETGTADTSQNEIDAKNHYLEEINHFLQEDVKISSMTFLGYRRKPHAWAIADAIKEYEKGKNNATD